MSWMGGSFVFHQGLIVLSFILWGLHEQITFLTAQRFGLWELFSFSADCRLLSMYCNKWIGFRSIIPYVTAEISYDANLK